MNSNFWCTVSNFHPRIELVLIYRHPKLMKDKLTSVTLSTKRKAGETSLSVFVRLPYKFASQAHYSLAIIMLSNMLLRAKFSLNLYSICQIKEHIYIELYKNYLIWFSFVNIPLLLQLLPTISNWVDQICEIIKQKYQNFVLKFVHSWYKNSSGK